MGQGGVIGDDSGESRDGRGCVIEVWNVETLFRVFSIPRLPTLKFIPKAVKQLVAMEWKQLCELVTAQVDNVATWVQLLIFSKLVLRVLPEGHLGYTRNSSARRRAEAKVVSERLYLWKEKSGRVELLKEVLNGIATTHEPREKMKGTSEQVRILSGRSDWSGKTVN
jgi:hypothetical protein